MDYSKRLNDIVKQRKLTQEQTGKLMGIKQQTVSTFVNRRWPNLKVIERLCNGLGMELWEFFIDKDALMSAYGISEASINIAKGIDSLPDDLKEKMTDLINQQIVLMLSKASK
jgi:transcriptional regulator with XRE-family HTH domain